jgi:hypothetical protein
MGPGEFGAELGLCDAHAVSALFLKRRENLDQVSPLFEAAEWAETVNYGSNVFCFMSVEQKGGRGGGTNCAIPARLNMDWKWGWGAVPVIGFGMDAAGCHF